MSHKTMNASRPAFFLVPSTWLLLAGLAAAAITGGTFAINSPGFTVVSSNQLSGGTFQLQSSAGATTLGLSLSGGTFGVAPAPIFSAPAAPQAAADLSAAHAFPVPFRPAQGHTQITFTDLPTAAEITIFTINGERIRRLNKNDSSLDLVWNPVHNEKGERIASGLYIFLMRDLNTGEKKLGKLIVIR